MSLPANRDDHGSVSYRGVVYPWHCDHMGHMNNMWYAGKFDEASWNALLQVGITPSFLRDNDRGLASVEQDTIFKHELKAGDIIEVRSRIIEIREKVMRLTHTMFNAETGEEAASCTITAVYVDLKLRKSCPFPPAMRSNIERLAGLQVAA